MSEPQAMPIQPLIRFCDVTKRFDARPILSALDWSLAEGDTAVILGPSGSGKSVFLGLLLGFLKPDEGKVEFAPDLASDPFRHLAVVFQEDALFDDRSIAANLAMAVLERADVFPSLSAELLAKIDTALSDVGLVPDRVRDLLPSALSGGMRRRVALARALIRNPRILIADEPTSGLDPETSLAIFGLMDSLKQSHRISLVIITHDPMCAQVLGNPVYAFTPRAGTLSRFTPGSGLDAAPGAAEIQKWARVTQETYAHSIEAPLKASLPKDTESHSNVSRAVVQKFSGELHAAIDLLGGAILSLGVLSRIPSTRLLIEGFCKWVLDSLPLVLLIFALLGVVLLIQAERAVTDVGFSNRLPELLVLGLTRLAPIITGFLVAGRCGSAVTAHTGWMRLSNQDKAMRTMCMDPDASFFPPIFWSFCVGAPLLSISGLLAGWTSAWFILDFQLSSAQITARFFASQIAEYADFSTLFSVAAKSSIIGAGLAVISYGGGSSPKRSAREITSAITRGLVACFVWIAIVDATITLLIAQ